MAPPNPPVPPFDQIPPIPSRFRVGTDFAKGGRGDYVWPHSEGSPFNLERAWGRAGRITLRFSLTPWASGRFTIKLEPRIPEIALEIMAWGVFLRLSALMASGKARNLFVDHL